jgi:hypothetical protein
MTRTAVSSDQAPDALGPYSQAIIAGGLVFCSGMAGIDPATGAIADGIEAQTPARVHHRSPCPFVRLRPQTWITLGSVTTVVASSQ